MRNGKDPCHLNVFVLPEKRFDTPESNPSVVSVAGSSTFILPYSQLFLNANVLMLVVMIFNIRERMTWQIEPIKVSSIKVLLMYQEA